MANLAQHDNVTGLYMTIHYEEGQSLKKCLKIIRLIESITFWAIEEIDTTKIYTFDEAVKVAKSCQEFVTSEINHYEPINAPVNLALYNKVIRDDRNVKKFMELIKFNRSPLDCVYDAALDSIIRFKLGEHRHCEKQHINDVFGPPVESYLYWFKYAQKMTYAYYPMIGQSFYSRLLLIVLRYQTKRGNALILDDLRFLNEYKSKLAEVCKMAQDPIFDSLHRPRRRDRDEYMGDGVFNLYEIEYLIKKTESLIITKRQDETLHERVLASWLMMLLQSCEVKNVLSATNVFMGAGFIENIVEHRTLARLWNAVKKRREFEQQTIAEREDFFRKRLEKAKARKNAMSDYTLNREVSSKFHEHAKHLGVTKNRYKLA
ncbi:Uncharacterised protein [Enterobacter hormaechei]|uniref:hypothetical protein n=1 Tax=Enterobacter hormaechei TaxID=158836 RepID=UPI00079666CC|nr:hypothetical protein [Enterobacter hormaechei]CZW28737.1 Uncharacterised protein [Enterobacter hormaechei]CZX67634.1 Uncharacterised protein [Enterobacter hormaechei]